MRLRGESGDAKSGDYPRNSDARRILIAKPVQEWSEEQVQEWVGLIGLAADDAEVVRNAMSADEVDGEDLKQVTAAFEDSRTVKPLQNYSSVRRA